MSVCIRMSRQQFTSAVELAAPGEVIVYHVGSIMRDREIGSTFLEVNATALAAWDAMEAGKVALAQKKRASGDFEYRAVKLTAPFKPVEWWGPYAKQSVKHSKPHKDVPALAPPVVRGLASGSTGAAAPAHA